MGRGSEKETDVERRRSLWRVVRCGKLDLVLAQCWRCAQLSDGMICWEVRVWQHGGERARGWQALQDPMVAVPSLSCFVAVSEATLLPVVSRSW
eukprot:870841-Rhodomonas_salina.2